MTVLIILGVVVLGLVLAGCSTTRSGYESAPYTVLRTLDKFEVRDYPALTVVETPMDPSGTSADGSFSRLFKFITGKNDAKQKIAMTTPVIMLNEGTTASMAFVLPAQLKTSGVPKPEDGNVKVRELPAGRFAVLRFSGGRNSQKEAEALVQLKTWMAAEAMGVTSPPAFGYFDPPWTPTFLRRNEVMLRTEAGR